MEGGAEDGEEEKRRGAEDGEEQCSGGDQLRAALSDGLLGGCRPLFFFLERRALRRGPSAAFF